MADIKKTGGKTPSRYEGKDFYNGMKSYQKLFNTYNKSIEKDNQDIKEGKRKGYLKPWRLMTNEALDNLIIGKQDLAKIRRKAYYAQYLLDCFESDAYPIDEERRLNHQYGKEDIHPMELQPDDSEANVRRQQDNDIINSQKAADRETHAKITAELSKYISKDELKEYVNNPDYDIVYHNGTILTPQQVEQLVAPAKDICVDIYEDMVLILGITRPSVEESTQESDQKGGE